MAVPVKKAGSFGRRSAARNALAFVAAYLLVLQTAFAGFAAQQMQHGAEFDAHVICLNGETGAPQDAGQQHKTPFACCGVSCLGGAHALEGPAAPDQALTYPVAHVFEAVVAPDARDVRRRASEGAGPRAPPVIG